MGYISNTNLTTITGLIAPFKALKLRTQDGKKFDGERHMNPSLLLRMIGVGPRDASGANVELVISVCPILSGNSLDRHMWYTRMTERDQYAARKFEKLMALE